MKIGFVGLGKLGLPMALAVESRGHEVHGFDPSPDVHAIVEGGLLPYKEERAQALLAQSLIDLRDTATLALWADIVFVAVQTPHHPEYEGITPLPTTRADFDYSFLAEALRSVRDAPLVVVISTVLPGTLDRLSLMDCCDQERMLYNPSFIAMGTTIPDFLNPEFVLIGSDGAPTSRLREFYSTIHDAPQFVTTIKTAELTKVAYNTFIGLKIVFANAMMEICEKVGADVDDLVDALSLGHRRLMSPAYMRGGMGDGGGCHPRDNIALSWLARELDLSYDLFEAMMVAREEQIRWLAELAVETEQNIEILGESYKPETNLTVGSPARLLANILREKGLVVEQSDPYVTSDRT